MSNFHRYYKKSYKPENRLVMETQSNNKNPFDPLFGRNLTGNSALPKKNFEPSRYNTNTSKYEYVVDWQIGDNDDKKTQT